jgi:hypothetical protein
MANETQRTGSIPEDLTKKAVEFGRDLKSQASNFAGSAADTMKTQVANVSESTRELASDATDRMRAAVTEQKTAGADYVGNFAEIVRRASHEFDGQMPQAGAYIRKAAGQITTASDALRSRDFSQLVGDVQDFARQQPAAFFGAAVLAGFAAIRFFKSAPDSPGSGTAGSSANVGQGSYAPPGQRSYSTPGQGGSSSAGYSSSSNGGKGSSASDPGQGSRPEPIASNRGPVAGM